MCGVRRIPFVLFVLLAALAPGARASGPGDDLVDACTDAGLDDRVCANVAAATNDTSTDPARLAAYEQGWVHRALRLQSRLDEAEPMRNSLWPHTHNSYNSSA